MRWGFKEEAKRLAVEVRKEVGLSPLEPLDPRRLADEYGFPVYTIGQLADACPPEAVAYLTEDGRAVFSAALVPCGTGKFVLDNDSHADTRRRASIAHEMAHVLLEHPFRGALLNVEGCRAGDPDHEEEADWLGGELLIPYTAALAAAGKHWDDDIVADICKVSVRYAAMRMNASGARLVIKRQAARRVRPRS